MTLFFLLFLYPIVVFSPIFGMDQQLPSKANQLTVKEQEKKLEIEKNKKIEQLVKKSFIILINPKKLIETIPLAQAQQDYSSMTHLFNNHQQTVTKIPIIIEHLAVKKYFSLPHEFFLQNNWKLDGYTNKEGRFIKIDNHLDVESDKGRFRTKIAHLIEYQRLLEVETLKKQIEISKIEIDSLTERLKSLNTSFNQTLEEHVNIIQMLQKEHNNKIEDTRKACNDGYQEAIETERKVYSDKEGQWNEDKLNMTKQTSKLESAVTDLKKQVAQLESENNVLKINNSVNSSQKNTQEEIDSGNREALQQELNKTNNSLATLKTQNNRYFFGCIFLSGILLSHIIYYLYTKQLFTS